MFKKIGITGDTHGDLNLTKIKKAQKEGYDCLIITGDFGYIWDNSKAEIQLLRKIENMNITLLFVSGNHENFSYLKKYDIEEWHGGKVQFIKKNIIHLMRGQVFNINGKKYFTFGGAKSIDIFNRKENVDWWREELPTITEMENGKMNLCKHKNKIDYIITHTCYNEILKEVTKYPEEDELTMYLSFIKKNIEYSKWYFGHMHLDYHLNDKDYCIYDLILEI